MFNRSTSIEQCPGVRSDVGDDPTKVSLDQTMSPFRMTRHMWRSAKKIITIVNLSQKNEKVCYKYKDNKGNGQHKIDSEYFDPLIRGKQSTPTPIKGKYYCVEIQNAPKSILYKDGEESTKNNSEIDLKPIYGNNIYAVGKYVEDETKYTDEDSRNNYIFECDLGEHKTRAELGNPIYHKFKSVVFISKDTSPSFYEIEKKETTGGTRYKRKSTKKRSFRRKTINQRKTRKTK